MNRADSMRGETARAGRPQRARRVRWAQPWRRARQGAALVACLVVLGVVLAHDPIAAVFVQEAAAYQTATTAEAHAATSSSSGLLTLRLLNRTAAPHETLLVNGRRVAAFNTGVVQIRVGPGDRVQLDGRAVASATVVRATLQTLNGTAAQTLVTAGTLDTLVWVGSP